MAEYVTKQEIVEAILVEDTSIDPVLPRLSFDNKEQDTMCENCGYTNAMVFKYNASCSAGYNSVVFEWAPDVRRVVVRGYACTRCKWHEIFFMYPVVDNDSSKVTNVEIGTEHLISHSSGESKEGDSL